MAYITDPRLSAVREEEPPVIAEFVKWLIVGMFALGALLTIAAVGRPRKPMTSGTAATVVAFNALYIVLMIVFWKNG